MDCNTIRIAQYTGSLLYIHDQLANMVNGLGLAGKINPRYTRIYHALPVAVKRKWYICGVDGICSMVKADTKALFEVMDEEAKNPKTDTATIYKLTYLHNVYEAAEKRLDTPSTRDFYDWAVSLPKSVSWGNTTADTMLEYAYLGGRAYNVAYVR